MSIPAIDAVNVFQVKSSFNQANIVKNASPALQNHKDTVSFKGYDKFIKNIVSCEVVSKSQVESIFFELFDRLLNSKYTKTADFKTFEELYEHKSLHSTLKALAGDKFSSATDLPAKHLLEKSQRGDVDLVCYDGLSLLRLRTDEMPNLFVRKLSLQPSNIAELKFNSELGGSSCVFGVNPNGELTLTQFFNMGLPRYTSFHNSNGKIKVSTLGEYADGNFVGKYYNSNGTINYIKSLFLH